MKGRSAFVREHEARGTYAGDTAVEDAVGSAAKGHGDDGGSARRPDLFSDPVQTSDTSRSSALEFCVAMHQF